MTHDDQRPSALETLDRDPASRKRFLTAVGGTGAAAAFSLFLAACGGDDKSSSSTTTSTQKQAAASPTEMFGKGDLGILGYALTLEYLETDFYADAAKSGKLSGKVLAVAKEFGSQ